MLEISHFVNIAKYTHDRCSIYSTVQKFCPNYGLLLESHTLTPVLMLFCFNWKKKLFGIQTSPSLYQCTYVGGCVLTSSIWVEPIAMLNPSPRSTLEWKYKPYNMSHSHSVEWGFRMKDQWQILLLLNVNTNLWPIISLRFVSKQEVKWPLSMLSAVLTFRSFSR